MKMKSGSCLSIMLNDTDDSVSSLFILQPHSFYLPFQHTDPEHAYTISPTILFSESPAHAYI